jgi:hypothetical protein
VPSSDTGENTEALHRNNLRIDVLMNKNRFAKAVAVAAGFVFLCAAPGTARAQGVAMPVTVQARNAAPPGAQPKGGSLPQDDFAALNYTDDQKVEIDKIHREMEARKETVKKAPQLTADQKDAMILGYTRLERGEVFKVLSPAQQSQVRQRILARKAAEQAQKKQPSRD